MSSDNPITLFVNNGQTVTLALQTTDGYGARVDGYIPQVNEVLSPSLQTAIGYPQNMTKVDTGLYVHQIAIPEGSSGLGTFVVSTSFIDPGTGNLKRDLFLIHAALPFGNSTITPL